VHSQKNHALLQPFCHSTPTGPTDRQTDWQISTRSRLYLATWLIIAVDDVNYAILLWAFWGCVSDEPKDDFFSSGGAVL